MSKDFEIYAPNEIPKDWDNFVSSNKYLKSDFIEIYKVSTNLEFRLVKGLNFACIEYDIKIDIFSFLKNKFPLYFKITVIGIPVSICAIGYSGTVSELIKAYKKRKGLFLILNSNLESLENVSSGNTLSNFIFDNTFDSFVYYLKNLRHSYRRRINKAIEKGKNLSVKKIKNSDFSDTLHDLYLQVLKNSKYPLETLNKNFFIKSNLDIHVFYAGEKPVAFVSLMAENDILNFIFGGMDYSERDEYDLYYNMLILILKIGIDNNFKTINFGQTAETAKMRIGCNEQKIYMHLISNRFLGFIFKLISNKKELKHERIFK